MATFKSEQVTQITAGAHAPLMPNELHGRVRVAYFEWNSTTHATGASVAANDVINLAIIPSGARILRISGSNEDLGSGAVTVDFGLAGADGKGYIDTAEAVADDPDLFTASPLAMGTGTAGEFTAANTLTSGMGYPRNIPAPTPPAQVPVLKECYLTATIVAEVGFLADVDLCGYVLYVVD